MPASVRVVGDQSVAVQIGIIILLSKRVTAASMVTNCRREDGVVYTPVPPVTAKSVRENVERRQTMREYESNWKRKAIISTISNDYGCCSWTPLLTLW
jgi:ABC-type phosphate transport system ATPase subunit